LQRLSHLVLTDRGATVILALLPWSIPAVLLVVGAGANSDATIVATIAMISGLLLSGSV